MTNKECFYCKTTTDELRPYGPKGTWVCFPCAFATPERTRETESALNAQMKAAGPLILLGEETGPRPLLKGKSS